ncbi:Nitrogen permease regulator 2 [Podila epigama]|nr:Nitrogen permease regulator 2 [Podila epigama]
MGFPRLLSIFYCTFHPTQGPKVLYEVPEGSILSKTSPLVDFDSISEFLIPKVELCNKLVTISTPTCKVIGYPINLEHKKFQRNALMFNLAFVFDKDAEISSYEPVVRKMARVLKALEKESEFLSRQTRLAMMDNGTLANLAAITPQSSIPPPSSSSTGTTTGTTTTTTTTTAPAATAGTATSVNGTFVPSSQTNNAPSTSIPTASTSQGAQAQTTANSMAATTGPSSLGTDAAASMSSMSLAEKPSSNTTSPSPSSSTFNGVSSSLPPMSSGQAASTNVISSSMATATAIATSASSISPPPTPASTITSTALVSSPPSISGNAITTILTAPPSSSPFPPSKAATLAAANQNGVSSTTATTAATNPTTKPPASPLLLQRDQIEHGSGMQNLIEQLIEDLNSYCECQIPIDSANTINLKLFPTYPNPTPVYDYQVPISTVNLEALTDVNWDMTMQRITGYINGVNSVKRIAEYADVETGLARMCMSHLLYYGCIIMVDLFQFKNIYAVKIEMMRLTEDVALQCECVSYVTLPDMHAPSFAKIFSLYCSLQYGVVLQDWIEQNQISEYNIDVRRFISFGVIKGFLYRVHKYPILDYHDPATAIPPSSSKSDTAHSQQPQQGTAPNSVNSSSVVTPSPSPAPTPLVGSGGNVPATVVPGGETQAPRKLYGETLAPTDQNTYMTYSQYQQLQQQQQQLQHPSNDPAHSGPNAGTVVIPPALRKLLDGQHHYDELCTQFGCSVRELDQILATDSRVKFIYR